MKEKKNEEKGILSKVIKKVIEILLKKECKMIKNININVSSTNQEILKGEINLIKITAENVNYKELLFNEIELQTNKLRINYQIINNKLNFKDSFSVKIKISLTGESLHKILNSQNWLWVGSIISEKLLKLNHLTDIKISNNIIELKASDKNNTNYKTELVKIESKEGKIHLQNINNMYSIIIPIEDKIYINKINIVGDRININAQSEISI